MYYNNYVDWSDIMTSNEYETNFSKSKQCLTTGLVLGTTLAATTIINPKIRKVAIPTYKYLAKQQMKILAGVGLFSIVSMISSKDESF